MGQEEGEERDGEGLNHHAQIINRMMGTEDTAMEDSKRKGGTRSWQLEERQFLLCGVRNSVTLSPAVLLKAEPVSNELGYIVKEISK